MKVFYVSCFPFIVGICYLLIREYHLGLAYISLGIGAVSVGLGFHSGGIAEESKDRMEIR